MRIKSCLIGLAALLVASHAAPVADPEAFLDLGAIAIPAITGSALIDGLLLGKLAFLKSAILANVLLNLQGGGDSAPLEDGYGAPALEYGAPAPVVDSYGAPAVAYEEPAPAYDAPAPQAAYDAPAPQAAPAYAAPAPVVDSYGAPQADTYGAPQAAPQYTHYQRY